MMPIFKARPFPGAAEDDDILRRLGAAIAIHWDTIQSDVLKIALIEQAVMIEGESSDSYAKASSLKAKIKSFIHDNKAELSA
jgi:hypothetical protein